MMQAWSWTDPKVSLFAAAFLVAGCVSPAAQGVSNSAAIMYEGSGTGEIEVFDLLSHTFALEDRTYLLRRKIESDIGSAFELCSNQQYHCLDEILPITIPKDQIAGQWEFNRIDCRAGPNEPTRRIVYAISCRSLGDMQVDFRFSRTQGVISYSRKCPDCEDTEFKLLSPVGLFGSPRQ